MSDFQHIFCACFCAINIFFQSTFLIVAVVVVVAVIEAVVAVVVIAAVVCLFDRMERYIVVSARVFAPI